MMMKKTRSFWFSDNYFLNTKIDEVESKITDTSAFMKTAVIN